MPSRVAKAEAGKGSTPETASDIRKKEKISTERENLCNRYGLKSEYIEEILNRDNPENFNIYEIMLEIGKKRGCMISGGIVDEEKTAKIILDEFKNGKLGRITLEFSK